MKIKYLTLVGAIALTGCVTAPATPQEAYLNRYALAQAVAMNCPAYGGYGAVASMRTDAEKNLSAARSLGATEADVKKAQNRANGNLMGATVMIGDMQACSAAVSNLAWAGSSTPVIAPRTKPKTTP